MRSGLAEILKHGLIANKEYWEKATELQKLTLEDLEELIAESIEIKTRIVEQDPTEQNIRKTLNFGHTLGHAIESYYLSHPKKEKLLHGEAIAIGMILALYISTKISHFPEENLKEITRKILELFPKVEITDEDFEKIIELLKFDKKNTHGRINFVLLKDIGDPVMDCTVPNNLIYDALEYYKNA